MLLAALLVFSDSLTVTAADIPDSRLLPRLVDEADLLTSEEEEELLERLDEISERQNCDVAVVTVNSMEGKTTMEYADDFYDYNGYGYGTERDGILLLVSMEDRDWGISTCGYGITVFTDAGLEYLSGKFLPDLSNGRYSKAFTVFAERCDDYITQARTGEPYDTGNLPHEPVDPVWIPIDVGIGLFLAFVSASRKKLNLKSVKKNVMAHNYVVPGSLVLSRNSDRYINKTVTTRTLTTTAESSSSGSGGSSTHTSSSGTTHGGTSGKF